MANFNKVLLIGNLTRDPELRKLPSGSSVCDTAIATNRKYRTADGQDREETCFIDLVLYGRQADVLHQWKKKGDPLFVEGRLKLDTWKGKDGSNHSKHRVIVENFQFLGQRGGRGGGMEPEAVPAGAPFPASRDEPPFDPGADFGNGGSFREDDVPF
ncbi:MAG: single-stranded DNA-binding protein [Planctomycetes bacterium]|nr:single-stranded DNA-binding protein [Planctomycetota bacterium]